MDPAHTAHRVKLQGLLLDPPDGGSPYVVNIDVDKDFELFHRNPKVRVKCTVTSCETTLSAKQMSKSGLRFFAVRTGFCNHNEVARGVSSNDTAIDIAAPLGGGGLESSEHLWIKYRLFNICRTLGIESIIEHQPTHADLYIPDAKLAVEYQRWDTEFMDRTRARTTAGARTLWMFPRQPVHAPRSRKLVAFNTQVHEHGALFLSVLDSRNLRKPLRPWDDSRLNKHARLYVSGSVAIYDNENNCLKSGQVSLPRFLSQVVAGTRTLIPTNIRERSGQVRKKLAWVEEADLTLVRQTRAKAKKDAEHVNVHRTDSEVHNRPVSAQLFAPTAAGELPGAGATVDSAADDGHLIAGVAESSPIDLIDVPGFSLRHPREFTPLSSGPATAMASLWRKIRQVLGR